MTRKLMIFGVGALSLLVAPSFGETATRDKMPQSPDEVRELLSARDAPDAAELGKVIVLFRDRNPLVREAAIARLRPYPKQAAGSVLRVLEDGKLASSLTAVELLRLWKAPVGSLDPWRLETVREAMKELRSWAESLPEKTKNEPVSASSAEIERDLLDLLGKDDDRALAALERLSRLGRDFLPQVRKLEAEARDDRSRVRLAMLRYRLVIPRSLALREPELAELLATAGPERRVVVIDRLGENRGKSLRGLLLELFLDPHPLVRESALKALRKCAGEDASEEFGRMLSDPDPNVRAAVLKELTENPSPEAVSEIQDFIAKETDEDLLVHAARALGQTNGSTAIRCLLALSGSNSWRVRSEAADGIVKRLSENGYSMKPRLKEQMTDAALRLLNDQDSFVVSKGIAVTEELEVADAVPVLAEVARKHADLAPEAIKAMARSDSMRKEAIKHLRVFCSDASPTIRAAAIETLATSTEATVEDEVRAALSDPESSVRRAALAGLRSMIDSSFEYDEDRLTRKWPKDFVEPLLAKVRPLMKAVGAEERLAAASVVAVLGAQEEAFPVLKALVQSDRALGPEAAYVLSDLEWPKRKELFEILFEANPEEETRRALVYELAERVPKEARSYFWALVDRVGTSADMLPPAARGLALAYLGNRYYDSGTVSEATLKELFDDAKQHIDRSRPGPATVALAAAIYAYPAEGEVLCREIFMDQSLPRDLRGNALDLILRTYGTKKKRSLSMSILRSDEEWAKEAPLAYLAIGQHAPSLDIMKLGKEDLGLHVFDRGTYGEEKAPKPPKSLTAELLKPLLKSEQGPTAVYAGFLLAVLGDNAGLPVLAKRWRADKDDPEIRGLLVQATIGVDDDSQVSTLAEVYESMDKERSWELGGLYEQLKLMSGKNARDLRRRMRKEVGVEKLHD